MFFFFFSACLVELLSFLKNFKISLSGSSRTALAACQTCLPQPALQTPVRGIPSQVAQPLVWQLQMPVELSRRSWAANLGAPMSSHSLSGISELFRGSPSSPVGEVPGKSLGGSWALPRIHPSALETIRKPLARDLMPQRAALQQVREVARAVRLERNLPEH